MQTTIYRSSSTSLEATGNLRITLWGTQGSCPVFPAPHEVEEYTRRIACYALARAMEDLATRSKDGPVKVEDLLGGPISEKTVEAYQKKLGLPDVPVYGGETTCVEVETADGNILIFDGGSGIRHCALSIVRRWGYRKNRKIYVFGSHEHLDHRSGLPFARFVFVKDNPFHLHLYGSHGFLRALDTRFGLFSHVVSPIAHLDDPLDYRFMAAKFTATELSRPEGMPEAHHEGQRPWGMHKVEEPIKIDQTTVTPFDVYHGDNRCLAYKVELNGSSFVFCTDHELRRGTDPKDPRQIKSEAAEARLRKELMNVDAAYMDGQYFIDEYLGKKGIGSSPAALRMDWGHSCIEDVIDRAVACNVKETYIGHSDPEREWQEKVEIDMKLSELSQQKGRRIELAKGQALIEV
ncbi:MAG TPA: hypothetical protein VEJ63_16610 [Planctomycetota bacterium]|nr:hypothetical protein [Planctomycetota bacterium]